ncbi:MFS transporter [Vibrio crassostreae]|uniref:MFS transporter n=1 Tax=Vibrio crassostreae TaxID=246167 RepID=UPI0006379EBB|nr:MFS transporter [Vibrio crassostreae]TCO00440.1 putative MFS family arabinose efflux permease [Vibrio crassostreae]TCT52517.1 putative MFS family arabinose efflux permease [Vibrio crassostreae]TCT61071.1 putative MFS family arabinose efflux permease [Vibrio crassostreae]TCT77582.1 putative MFS family arabinose efflux permease [Vibrio crassostreae]TCT96234.1 putative MFS family arabinose efflux permease [Vibrio crassostreae]
MSIFRFPLLVWLGIGTLIISLGIRQSFGIFMMPISEHFGTGREFFSFAIALQNLLFGVFQPFVGMAADKWGARRIIIAGACAYGLGLLLTSISTESSMLYVSLGALVGLGLSATSYVIVLGAVAKVVPAEHAAKAFGLTTAAGSFGMFAVIPGAQYMLNEFDWQSAMQVFGVLCCLMISFALFMRAPKAASSKQAQAEDNQTLKEALSEAFSNKSYWLIHAGFFVCGFHVMFIATHLPSYLADKNLPASSAAMALAYVGIFNIFGSYFWGVMGDKFSKRHVMSALYLVRTVVIGAFVTLPVTESTAAIFGAAIGFCWLGTVPLTSGLVRQIFGARYLSTLYGLVFFTHQVGSFLGAWVGGRIYDYYGSYELIWWSTVVLAFAAALIHLPINDKPIERIKLAMA